MQLCCILQKFNPPKLARVQALAIKYVWILKRFSHTKKKKKHQLGSKSSYKCYELEKPSFIFRKEISITQDERTRKERKGKKPALQNILCFPTLTQQAIVSTDRSEYSVKIISIPSLSGLSVQVYSIVGIFIFHSDKKMSQTSVYQALTEKSPLVLWKCPYAAMLLVCTPVEIATQLHQKCLQTWVCPPKWLPGCCARHTIVDRECHCCRETFSH